MEDKSLETIVDADKIVVRVALSGTREGQIHSAEPNEPAFFKEYGILFASGAMEVSNGHRYKRVADRAYIHEEHGTKTPVIEYTYKREHHLFRRD